MLLFLRHEMVIFSALNNFCLRQDATKFRQALDLLSKATLETQNHPTKQSINFLASLLLPFPASVVTATTYYYAQGSSSKLHNGKILSSLYHDRTILEWCTVKNKCIYIFEKPLHECPARLQRTRLRLQQYQLKVYYKKGSELHIADTLSRGYIASENDNSLEELEVHIVLPMSTERLEQLPYQDQ